MLWSAVPQHRHLFMGVNIMGEEKEIYKNAIVDTILKIDRLDMLIYLHRLISRIAKEGR